MPTAICAAFSPDTPPPMTMTLAGATPGTPPGSTPRPPLNFIRLYAPTCGASRPATSDMGASNGSERFGSCTVSYATAVTPVSSSASVQAREAARWR